MSVAKKIALSFFSILMVIFLAVNIWWLILFFLGPDKLVSNTFNVGEITTADGTLTKPICEVDYNANADKKGLEKLDIRWNYYADETRDVIYSQGLQYVGNSKNDKIAFEYKVDANFERTKTSDDKKWPVRKQNWTNWGTYVLQEGSARYNYASENDFETVTNATNPLGFNSRLKIELDNEIYMMKFKGANTPALDDNFMYKDSYTYLEFIKAYNVSDNYFCYYGFDYFSMKIHNALQTKQFGKGGTYLFEFGDLFDYYKYDAESKEYKLLTKDAQKVIKDVRTNFSIKVNIHENGAQSAQQDSIFKCLYGNCNFVLNPDSITDDYFFGRSEINISINDFDMVPVHENNVALALSNKFKNYYNPYVNKIVLSVLIDVDELKKLGYEFFGFAKYAFPSNYQIKEVYKVETINGQRVTTEVAYEK